MSGKLAPSRVPSTIFPHFAACDQSLAAAKFGFVNIFIASQHRDVNFEENFHQHILFHNKFVTDA
jgi:hypothetical protein